MSEYSLLFTELHYLLYTVQSHLAIPERAEPDTSLNGKESLAPLCRHRISLLEKEKRRFRIHIIFLKTLPWSL
ncbi:hypothetical protein L873DRAFT_1801715 [Choiromyces venosus 120613-1]|uniref:Uncharacterized protein n=1 Tax=Choiromyces venosus 120613-1 TaxID=1336337 RepID=A0A3N4K2T3_9PEZI|nr:hypothetical protein L873DRAFT_1801715 [Choiromyces venosus 120613-1]